jgi:raffinose/stachyose/melibiose transport system permease protein
MTRKQIGKTVSYILLSLWAFTTIYPLVWVLINSFKGTQEIIEDSFTLPSSLFLDNYLTAFDNNILRGYMNSLIISVSVVVAVLIIGALASYIMARFRFPGKAIIQTLIISSLMVPVFATIVPVFEILIALDLFNNYLGLILPQIAGNLAFTISVLTSYMTTIPIEMEEAAFMEGCTPLQVFSKIILPITKPSLAASAIFVFLWSYNDLFSSLIILRTRDKMPINVLLTDISSQYGINYGLMAAAIAIIVVPVLVVYVFAQRFIIEGMTSGAVKG